MKKVKSKIVKIVLNVVGVEIWLTPEELHELKKEIDKLLEKQIVYIPYYQSTGTWNSGTDGIRFTSGDSSG